MRHHLLGSIVIVAIVASSATAFAARPWGGQPASSTQASSSNSQSGNVSSSTGSNSASVSNTAKATFGTSVSAAIAASRAAGGQGAVLAEAVHAVLSHEHANAKGLAVAMSVYASSSSGSSGSSPFTDLTTQAPWATPAVSALHQAGVIEGTSSTSFSPNDSVTLAQLATMLARLQAGTATSTANVPAGTPSWAASAMAWSQASGVLDSEQGLGQPNVPLTRAQAVLMLINAAGLGQTAWAEANAPINLTGNVPTWAHGAIALAIQLGLLQGSDGQVLANSTLTRAQTAVLLARLAVLEAEATGSTSTSTTTTTGTSTSASN